VRRTRGGRRGECRWNEPDAVRSPLSTQAVSSGGALRRNPDDRARRHISCSWHPAGSVANSQDSGSARARRVEPDMVGRSGFGPKVSQAASMDFGSRPARRSPLIPSGARGAPCCVHHTTV
jgi:hypothetical protein